MEKLTEKITAINLQLADNDIYADKNKQKLQQLLLEKSDLEKSHENAEIEWFEVNEELEKIN